VVGASWGGPAATHHPPADAAAVPRTHASATRTSLTGSANAALAGCKRAGKAKRDLGREVQPRGELSDHRQAQGPLPAQHSFAIFQLG
jgi:hypothetical protein